MLQSGALLFSICVVCKLRPVFLESGWFFDSANIRRGRFYWSKLRRPYKDVYNVSDLWRASKLMLFTLGVSAWIDESARLDRELKPSLVMRLNGQVISHCWKRKRRQCRIYIGETSHKIWPFNCPGNLMKRSHIRWWNAGLDHNSNRPKWLGAISWWCAKWSSPYSGIVTILHRVDPNVDEKAR